jgi:hypothetical protein
LANLKADVDKVISKSGEVYRDLFENGIVVTTPTNAAKGRMDDDAQLAEVELQMPIYYTHTHTHTCKCFGVCPTDPFFHSKHSIHLLRYIYKDIYIYIMPPSPSPFSQIKLNTNLPPPLPIHPPTHPPTQLTMLFVYEFVRKALEDQG